MKKIVVAIACAALFTGLNTIACGGMTAANPPGLAVDCLYDNIELNEAMMASVSDEVVCP